MMLSIYFALRAFKQSGRREDWSPTAAAEDGHCLEVSFVLRHVSQDLSLSAVPPFLTCRNYLSFLTIPESQLW